MSSSPMPTGPTPSRWKRITSSKLLGGIAVGVVVAVFGIVATSVWNNLTNQATPIEGSAQEQFDAENPVYIAGTKEPPPTAPLGDLKSLAKYNAAPAVLVAVTVNLEGGTAQSATIENIGLTDVKCFRTRPGIEYQEPAGGGPDQGRYMWFSLDSGKPTLLQSSGDINGWISEPAGGDEKLKPMSFPWTVSLSSPVLVTILVESHYQDCTWRIKVDWAAGSDSGEKVFDNSGVPYRVVGVHGLRALITESGEWTPTDLID